MPRTSSLERGRREEREKEEKEAKNPWVLYYWPEAGRGDFVKLVLEEVGVSYTEVNDRKFLHSVYIAEEKEQQGYPCFAVPVIKRADLKMELSQTPVICKYLGRRYTLFPKTEEQQWHAEAVNLTIHDFYSEIVEDDFKVMFRDERAPKYLDHFEDLLEINEDQEGKSRYLFGDKLTYPDLGLFHILRLLEAKYPEAFDDDFVKDRRRLKAFYSRIKRRPKIAEFLKSKARDLIDEY